MALGAAYIVAAPDPVASWGAQQLMCQDYQLSITAITGPATDNEVGRRYIAAELNLPAHNARLDAVGLMACVSAAVDSWRVAHEAAA